MNSRWSTSAAPKADQEGEERRDRPSRSTVFMVTSQNAVVVQNVRVVVEADEDLVRHRQAGRRVEERQIDRVVDRIADNEQHHRRAPAAT